MARKTLARQTKRTRVACFLTSLCLEEFLVFSLDASSPQGTGFWSKIVT